MIYLVFYALTIGALVLLREKGQKSTPDRFLVADRKLTGTIGSMSIAASWIWAPAIFISSQVGFKWGYAGLFWFVVPNMLALVIFAPLAKRVRSSLPHGYNYIEFLRGGDRSFLRTQLWMQLVMQVAIFAIQLVAGAELLAKLTGADYHWLAFGMAITPLSYTFFSGLRTSVFTDAIQYIVIAFSAVALVCAFPHSLEVIDQRPFHPFDHDLLFDFGLSSALGLLVAIFADNQQWQRAFATKDGAVTKVFYRAAIFHGLVTTLLGTLGVLVFTTGFVPARPDLVGFEFVQTYYPLIFVPIFVVMALCALISTLDSALCAFSSLAMKELFEDSTSLRKGRSWMALLTGAGLAVALTRPELLTLWFVTCTIRLSSFFPTLASIVFRAKPTRMYTVAIVSSLVIGGTFFAYGVWIADNHIRTIGMILTLCISGAIIAGSRLYFTRCTHSSAGVILAET